MAKKTRRRFSPEFKAQVAMEALKGLKTTSEIAALYEIHPTQVSQWKRDLTENASSLFDGPRQASDEADIAKMRKRHHAKIGQLTLEVDWLKKKCKELQIPLDDEL